MKFPSDFIFRIHTSEVDSYGKQNIFGRVLWSID